MFWAQGVVLYVHHLHKTLPKSQLFSSFLEEENSSEKRRDLLKVQHLEKGKAQKPFPFPSDKGPLIAC